MASATLTLRPIRGSVSFIAHKCIAQPPSVFLILSCYPYVLSFKLTLVSSYHSAVALSNEGKDIFHLSNFLDTDSHTLCLPYEVRTRDAEAIVSGMMARRKGPLQHSPD